MCATCSTSAARRAADLLGTRGRGRAADRHRLSAQGQARLHRADREPGRPARSRRAPNCRTQSRLLLPGFFVRVRVPLEETPALLVPIGRARQRPGRALCADRQRREHRRAAQGRGRPDGRRDGGDRERAEAGRSRGRRRHPARDPGTEGRSADADRRALRAQHDLQILHRAAGPRQRAGDPDDRHRRGRAVRRCRSRNIPT